MPHTGYGVRLGCMKLVWSVPTAPSSYQKKYGLTERNTMAKPYRGRHIRIWAGWIPRYALCHQDGVVIETSKDDPTPETVCMSRGRTLVTHVRYRWRSRPKRSCTPRDISTLLAGLGAKGQDQARSADRRTGVQAIPGSGPLPHTKVLVNGRVHRPIPVHHRRTVHSETAH